MEKPETEGLIVIKAVAELPVVVEIREVTMDDAAVDAAAVEAVVVDAWTVPMDVAIATDVVLPAHTEDPAAVVVAEPIVTTAAELILILSIRLCLNWIVLTADVLKHVLSLRHRLGYIETLLSHQPRDP